MQCAILRTERLADAMREQIAQTFRGLTPGRLALILVFVVCQAVFGWAMQVSIAREAGIDDLAFVFLQEFVATAILLVSPVLAGLAAYNRAPVGLGVRIPLAGGMIAVAAWYAQRLAFAVDAPVYASIYDRSPGWIGSWVIYSTFGACATGLVLYIRRADDLARDFESEEMRRANAERALDEARLQAAQAQIEPHFLFNTLANVRWLYGLDASGARAMLQQFSRMLVTALPGMRDARSTLGKELALAIAYLSVQKIRMGERLEFETRVANDLRDAELPPLMLSTLVENAVKHGLAPLAQGGRIRITAERRDSALRVLVADSGRGLAESSGSGAGLANTEVRLAALYGADGFLDLQTNDAGGVTAVIQLPLRILPVSHGERAVA